MLSEVYDIEVLSNLFTYTGFCRQTKTYHQFVIHQLQNDLELLHQHLYRDTLIMIGYNNDKYDYPIIHHILNHFNEYKFLSGQEIAQKLYQKSQEVISMEFSAVAEWNKKILQIDLMKIWHYDSIAKATSLKDIEFYMRLDKIEDMPFSHDYWVFSFHEINQILSYNKHDVYATTCLLDITLGKTDNELYKGQDKIQLRQDIQREFKIQCLNYNDVKIGEEINKSEYLKRNPNLKGRDLKGLVSPTIPFTYGEAIPNYIKFETKEFNKLYETVKNVYVDLVSDKDDKQQFPFIYNGTKYTISRGGIHSCESGRRIIPNKNQILRDADIGSQYPNAIRKRLLFPKHLGKSWLEGYVANIYRRIDAKHLGKKTKEPKYNSIADTYKLALNGGGYGKTGEPKNWQFDPRVQLFCCIGNQFEILMLVEMLELKNIHCISANTDGIVCLFDKSLEQTYYDVCKEWEIIVGNNELGQLEYIDYKMLVQTSINDYIAVKFNGEVKLKGDFCIDVEMHKNPSMRIVPIAIKEYFVNNIPVRTTIENHKDIYDFCIRMKTNRSYQGEYHYLDVDKQVIKNLSKTTRYFISNKGGSIYKREKTSGKRIGEKVGFVATLFNNFFSVNDIKEYNINYGFYIKEANKLIEQIDNPQMSFDWFK